MPRAGYSPEVLRRALRVAELVVIEDLTLSKIARVEGMSVSTASRLFRIAKESDMVKQYVISPDALSVDSEITSEELQRTEDALQEALMLRAVAVVAAPRVLVGRDGFNCAQDDRLTQLLGEAAAGHLVMILRDGDVLGVGGGRSVYFAAIGLSAGRRRALHGLTVASLAGGLGVYPLAEGPPLLMSADGSAALAAHALKAVRVIRRGEPGYQSPGSRLRFFWSVDDSGPIRPNVAVVGIGAVANGIHTCFDQLRHELDHELDRSGTQLADEITSQVEALRQQLKEHRVRPCGALYSPVADILARPFVVTPPNEVLTLIGADQFENLKAVVEELAQRVYAASPQQLAGIDHVVVVAGGARKAFPIWDFFVRFLQARGGTGSWRHSLVTDYWTAKDLLAIADVFASGITHDVSTPAR